jgi:hypothetical protein
MICSNCHYAGQQLQFVAENPAVLKLVETAHNSCRGGTWCDCMHQLTSGLNLQRINAATMDKKDEPPSSE